MAAQEGTAEVVASGEAARLVEKWLGISSLPALYEADALTSGNEETRMPGLGLGAQPSAQQQTKQQLTRLDKRLASRIAAHPAKQASAPQVTGSNTDHLSDGEAEAGRAGAFLDRAPPGQGRKAGKEHFGTVAEQRHNTHHCPKKKKFKGAASST